MRIVRFLAKDGARYGLWEKDIISSLQGSPFDQPARAGGALTVDGTSFSSDEVKLLAPCLPSKIVCLGLNYRKHAQETGLPLPPVPLIFLKPSTAVIGPGDNIVLPRDSRRVDYEGELAVVIGRRAKDVPEDRATEYILGYTCLNDVSERYAQKEDGQWTRAKGYDTFAPIGPCIVTDIAADSLRLETYLNDGLRQSTSTSDLIFPVPRLISFISGVMTLLPGDVVATGTPAGVGPMKPGDVVEVKIQGIGTLRNPVVRQG